MTYQRRWRQTPKRKGSVAERVQDAFAAFEEVERFKETLFDDFKKKQDKEKEEKEKDKKEKFWEKKRPFWQLFIALTLAQIPIWIITIWFVK